jgi:hypothetical protein
MNNKQIVEPISTMARIIMLNFYPEGTKIGIIDHKLQIQKPNNYQGLLRSYYAQNKDEISHILDVILRLIYWYNKNDFIDFNDNIHEHDIESPKSSQKEEIEIDDSEMDSYTKKSTDINGIVKYIGDIDEFKCLLRYMNRGFKCLQSTYKEGNVYFTLQYFINLVDDFIDGTFHENKIPSEYLKEWRKRESYLKKDVLRNIWDISNIIDIKNKFDECFKTISNKFIKDEKKDVVIKGHLKSIDALINVNEIDFITIVKECIQG